MAADYERAKLQELLGEMQSSVKDFAALKQTPAKGAMPMSPIKEHLTAEKTCLSTELKIAPTEDRTEKVE